MNLPRIVGFGGTNRPNSTSERLAREVLGRAEALGATTHMFGGTELTLLPHYVPEQAARNQEQVDFVEAVRQADGIVIASPSYHGGASGLVKNAIDLLEDLRNDRRPYFDSRAVGLIVSAAGWQAGGVTLAAMRGIVHAMRGWPTPVGIMVNTVAQNLFGEDGRLADPAVERLIEEQARQIMFMAKSRAVLEQP